VIQSVQDTGIRPRAARQRASGARGRPRSTGLSWAGRVPVYVVLGVGTVLMVMPLLWMITASLATTRFVTTFPPKLFPNSFDFGNYTQGFARQDLGKYLLNSVEIVVPSMAGQVLSSSLAGYAFARLRAPGKRLLFVVTLATVMIPFEATIVPTFVMFRYLHWLNTFWPLIVPQLLGNGYNIFLMRQFMTSIPSELDEAAKLDGCGFFTIWWRIICPLSVAPMTAVAVFTFTYQWGNFLGPLIYINDPSHYPLALGLYALTQTSNVGQTPPWNSIMAGSMLLTIPMVMVYFFSQRLLYEGANVLGRIR
jgi:multiple sugar transport system permease protein